MQKFIILLFVIFLGFETYSQEKIEGKVYDLITDEPIADATVKVVGENTFTSTDAAGKFSLVVAKNAQLEINHLNYETKIIQIEDAGSIALTPRQNSLDEILLSSNPLEDITHSITVVDDIKKGSQPRNAAELFNDINGFSIQKRSAMASEPSLRAFKYEQMNIKFDGATKICPACPNRMDPITSHVIPEEIGKIEVVKGPYTVRFGQTFGGVVNMVTTTPSEQGLHGSVQAGYELNGENVVTRAEIQYAKEKYDFTLNGEYRDFGNYKDGNGVETPAGFNTVSYSAKLGLVPFENHRLQLDWRQKFGKDIDHAGLPMDSPKDDSYAAALDYSIDKWTKTIQNFTLKGYYTFVDHLMNNALRPNITMMDAQTPVTSNSMGGKMEFTLRPNENALIFAGLDAEIVKRDGDRTRTVFMSPTGVMFNPPRVFIDKVWQDATTQDFGAFAEATYKFSKHWSVTSGIRSDFVFAEVLDPALDTQAYGKPMGTMVPGFENLYGSQFAKTDENTLGGNFGIKYHKNGTLVQLAYGLGTRSASMIERYAYHMAIGVDSYEYVGNPYLRPEQNNQLELALNVNKGNLTFGAGVFYSVMKDYISAVYRNADPNFWVIFANAKPYAKQFVNVDANQIGFDAFFGYKITKNISFDSNIAYTDAHNETYHEPLAKVSPFTANFSLKYETEKLWADIRTQVVSEQNKLATSFGETEITPGHTTVDFRIGGKVYKGLNMGASVLNIFDTAYYNHLNFNYNNAFDHLTGDKVYEPGRNVSVYAIYKF
ncbi:MAG: TonB-dependent receptor [Flavobacteriaceae bacterium]|nr:TonB-dependent receptor [Flavobacteriaceae bacterium]